MATVTHRKVSSGTVNTAVEVDLSNWNDTHVGVENVDNTSDVNKPVSTAQQAALDLKVTGAASSIANEIPIFSGTSGKTLASSGGTLLSSDGTLAANSDSKIPTEKAIKTYVAANAVSSIAGNVGAFTLANGIDNSTNQIQLTAARRTLPTTQVFLSGTGTYTTAPNALWIEIELVGPGGGGCGSGTTPGAGGAGGNTTFGALTGNGGGGGATSTAGGAGGTASGGFVNKTGAAGANGSGVAPSFGGSGANSPYGGAGAGGTAGAGPGIAAAANTGSGGGGGGVNATVNGGAGGGAGGFVRAVINSPAATYSYAIGAGGTAGTTGTSGAAGGAGGSGFIQVTEHYGS